MADVFQQVLTELEAAFRALESQVPPPVRRSYKDGFVLRYAERSNKQALLQKFARQISGLYALRLLLDHGFAQEQGVLQRMLDEIAEDIVYLALAMSIGPWTSNHTKYLDYFWSEDRGSSSNTLGMVQRKSIRAYVNRQGGLPDPSSADANGRRIYQAYSGYVHAKSENIMDMCVGEPPLYCLSGTKQSPLHGDHADDAWNYFYRGLVSAVWIAKAFEDSALQSVRYSSVKAFERAFSSQIF